MEVPRQIRNQLADDEEVRGVFSGNRLSGGIVVCTAQRVFILKRGANLNKTVSAYRYGQIASVHVSYGSRTGPLYGSDSMTVLHISTPGDQSVADSSVRTRLMAPNTAIFGSGKNQHAIADAAAEMIRRGIADAQPT